MRRIICLTGVVTLLLCVGPATAQVVIEAEPEVRVVSNTDSSMRVVLSDVDRAKGKLKIIWSEGRYLWASRDGRELVHSKPGAFHLFIDPLSGQYVKVVDVYELTGERPKGPRYMFMEHVNLWLDSITYWGSARTFWVAPGD